MLIARDSSFVNNVALPYTHTGAWKYSGCAKGCPGWFRSQGGAILIGADGGSLSAARSTRPGLLGAPSISLRGCEFAANKAGLQAAAAVFWAGHNARPLSYTDYENHPKKFPAYGGKGYGDNIETRSSSLCIICQHRCDSVQHIVTECDALLPI